MNPRQKHPQPRRHSAAYREAFERLDAALEKHTRSDNAEKIRWLRLALFGAVEEVQRSGRVVLPE